jgi:hypothetical protein
VRGEVGGAHLRITEVRGCRRAELCGGGELKMVVASGGALEREREGGQEAMVRGEPRD